MATGSSTHEDYTRRDTVEGGSDRAFGFVFAGFFAVVAVVLYLRGRGVVPWALVASGVFLVAALAFPRVLHPLNVAWTRFGALLHRVMSPLILALLYAVAIVPVGLLMRAFGKDPLRLRREPDAESYWIVRQPPGPEPESLTRQF